MLAPFFKRRHAVIIHLTYVVFVIDQVPLGVVNVAQLALQVSSRQLSGSTVKAYSGRLRLLFRLDLTQGIILLSVIALSFLRHVSASFDIAS